MATESISTVKPLGGGDYDSLAAWEAGEQGDISTATGSDEIAVAELYTDTTISGLDFNGWTMDSTCRAVIRPPTTGGAYQSAYYHYGIEGDGVNIDADTTDAYAFIVRSNHYLTVEGLELTATGNTIYAYFYTETNQTVRLAYNLIHNLYRSVFATSSCDYMKDCFIYDHMRVGSGNWFVGYGGKVINCSCYAEDDEGGFSGDIVIRNAECYNVALFHDHTTITYDSFYTCTGDYNATNQSSAPSSGGNSLTSLAVGDFDWVDYLGAAKDLHLASSGGSLIDEGVGNSSNSDVQTADIDLEAGDRAGSACGIGADEYGAGGAVEVTPGAASLVATTYDVTINAETSFTADSASLTATAYSPSVKLNVSVSASCSAESITAYAPNVNAETNIQASSAGFTITAYQANLGTSTEVSATSVPLEISTYQAGVNAETSIAVASASCEISSFAASVSLGVSVSASSAGLEINPQSANINAALNIAAGTESLEITTYQAILGISTEVSAGTAALEIASHTVVVGLDLDIPASSAAYTLTAHGAELSYDINVQALCYETLLTANDPTVTVGELNTIPASPLTLATPARVWVALPVRERIAVKASNDRLIQRVS